MRNSLLAASALCLFAGSAWAIPAPHDGLDGRAAPPKAAEIDRKDEIKVATCGWFVSAGVSIGIRRDRGGRVIHPRDWGADETYFMCI